MLATIIKWVFSPVVFGLAFIGPLIGQTLIATGLAEDIWLTHGLGLIAGLGLGIMAEVRGSWIWVKP